jgi:Rho termination factor, N-terminal domain
MTTVELKAIAKKRGIAGISKMKKDALIEALS